MACSCRPNSCRKCKGLGFSVTFRMLTSSAVGKDAASNNKTALQFCEIKVFITMTAEILSQKHVHLFTSAAEPLREKKKVKKGRIQFCLQESHLNFFSIIWKRSEDHKCAFFFANGDKRSMRISENRNCNANLNVNQKKKKRS